VSTVRARNSTLPSRWPWPGGTTIGSLTSGPARPHHTRVDGAVFDREGDVVAGATVVVRPAGAATTLAAATRTFQLVTDAKGHFHLDGVPPGTYWFVAFGPAQERGTEGGSYGVGGADLSAGSSPALPVIDHLELSIHLEPQSTRA